jgi:predicted dienelactone hydrolase
MKSAQFINGDPWGTPPQLAPAGMFRVGVQTLTWNHSSQIDVLATIQQGRKVLSDRTLAVEVWYPAQGAANNQIITEYEDYLGRGENSLRQPRPFRFQGRASRNATPLPGHKFPLLIVSHGYPGSRYLLSYLTENLASKGYVVVAVDHQHSTHLDASDFRITLMHRARDIRFIIDQVAVLAKGGEQAPWQFVDPGNIGLIGYSMGGYGVLNAIGAGYSEEFVNNPRSVPGNLLADLAESHPDFLTTVSDRVKAAITFAPWGARHDVWRAESMANLTVPLLLVAGDKDDVVGWDNGVKWLFENATSAERYLLVYQNCRHNVAPNPPPVESYNDSVEFWHYADPVWDMRRINNINQHFATAFLNKYLKQQSTPALDLIPRASDGDYTSQPGEDPVKGENYWWGFPVPTALGLEFYRANAMGPGLKS